MSPKVGNLSAHVNVYMTQLLWHWSRILLCHFRYEASLHSTILQLPYSLLVVRWFTQWWNVIKYIYLVPISMIGGFSCQTWLRASSGASTEPQIANCNQYS